MAIRTLIAPARYVQGKGALDVLGENLARIGRRPLIVADDIVWSLTGQQVADSLQAADLETRRTSFQGFATAAMVDQLVDQVQKDDIDLLVGLGGGSTIDAVKAAGHLAGIRWASVPTVASTDAPCSALSVIYTSDGSFDEYRFFPHNPDLVLVDSQLVANAPARFLTAGIGDALATWPEAHAVAQANSSTMAGGQPTTSATALAELSWNVLHTHALQAIEAVRQHVVTPALDKVIEANTLLSGLGFESGGLAAAHAIHDGLTAVPQTHGLTHGEKVNIGTLTQFILEGRPGDEIADFIEFTTKVGLPATLIEAGLGEADADTLRIIADAACAEGETIHNMPFVVEPADVVDAMRSLDGFACMVREARGLPAPKPMVTGH